MRVIRQLKRTLVLASSEYAVLVAVAAFLAPDKPRGAAPPESLLGERAAQPGSTGRQGLHAGGGHRRSVGRGAPTAWAGLSRPALRQHDRRGQGRASASPRPRSQSGLGALLPGQGVPRYRAPGQGQGGTRAGPARPAWGEPLPLAAGGGGAQTRQSGGRAGLAPEGAGGRSENEHGALLRRPGVHGPEEGRRGYRRTGGLDSIAFCGAGAL